MFGRGETNVKWLTIQLVLVYPRIYAFFCYYRKKERRKEIEDKFDFFLGGTWTPEKKRRVVRHIFELRGSRKVMRYLIPHMNAEYIKRWVRTEGLYHLDQALEGGRGVVLMTGHFGNPQFGFNALRVMGYDLVLVKGGQEKQRDRTFRYTDSVEDTIFINEASISEVYRGRIIETLRSGKIINYYGDTQEGRTKERIPFLGKAIDFPTGMIHLARQTKAAVIPFLHFYERGKITLILREPIDHGWERGEGEYQRIIQEFASILETYFLVYPEQYMGIYGPTALAASYRAHQEGEG